MTPEEIIREAEAIPVITVRGRTLVEAIAAAPKRRRSTWVGPSLSRREQQEALDRIGLDDDDIAKYGTGYSYDHE